MFAFARLHDIAAQRGDGLRPELLDLIVSRQAHGCGNVEDLSAHLAEHFTQAGPNPVGRLGEKLPAGVLPFRRLPKPASGDTQSRPSRHIR